jgi:AcrR family transcriptional regulator
MPRTRSAGLKNHLVEAADELLDHATPGSLTTRQIARHAAVSDGVLYNHFGDKDELLVAALVRRYGRLVETFEAALADANEAGQGSDAPLDGWLGAYARALRDLDAAALHLGAGLLAEPKLLEAFWIEIHRAPLGLDRLRNPLVERLRAEREAARLASNVDIDAAATLVFGASAMSAITLRVNARVDRDGLDRDLDAAVTLVLAGLRADR